MQVVPQARSDLDQHRRQRQPRRNAAENCAISTGDAFATPVDHQQRQYRKPRAAEERESGVLFSGGRHNQCHAGQKTQAYRKSFSFRV